VNKIAFSILVGLLFTVTYFAIFLLGCTLLSPGIGSLPVVILKVAISTLPPFHIFASIAAFKVLEENPLGEVQS
jgi:hypothetical protein